MLDGRIAKISAVERSGRCTCQSDVATNFIAMMLQRDAHDCEGKKNMLEQRSCHAFI